MGVLMDVQMRMGKIRKISKYSYSSHQTSKTPKFFKVHVVKLTKWLIKAPNHGIIYRGLVVAKP